MKKPPFGFKRIKTAIQKSDRPFPLSMVVLAAALGLLGHKLFRLIPFSNYEQATNLGSTTVANIQNDILFGPIKALQIFILKFTEDDAYIRLASVAVAATAAVLLYAMLRKWYSRRVTMMTTALFITSTFFLQQGRSANLDVMYLTVLPALLLICMWLLSKKNNKKLPLAAILLGLTLYVPGTWLFVAGGGIFLRNLIIKTIRQLNTSLLIGSAVALLATIAPLIYSFATNPGQIVRWIGFNTDQELSLSAIGSRVIAVPDELFFSGPNNAAIWLIGTPIFDIFSIVMIILGVYAYKAGYYPARTKLVYGSAIAAFILIAFGNVATIGLLLPILYIIVANGIAYMLQSWFTVFPRNLVARPLGVAMIILVVLGACSFHLQRYFVAWPQADATHKALTDKR